MIKFLYSVRDITAQIFCNPFIELNDATARRAFAQAANDPNSVISKNPECYSLSLVGSFNDECGEIESHLPVFLCNATDFIKRED